MKIKEEQENIPNGGIEYEPISDNRRIRWGNYMVHFNLGESHGLFIQFQVFSVIDYECDAIEGTSYEAKNSSGLHLCYEFDEDNCVMRLQGSVVWRGILDDRLYFPDDEYLGSEISKLAYLYDRCILVWCKNYLRENNPYYEDDEDE